jgi:hypothetical protein
VRTAPAQGQYHLTPLQTAAHFLHLKAKLKGGGSGQFCRQHLPNISKAVLPRKFLALRAHNSLRAR